MSNSTNAMNNVSKTQTTTGSGKKTSADLKDIASQFEALFSSAIVQLAPNTQLNTIEAQLRESLFKQDSKQTKKHTESNINTEAAQSTLWAQRNWMQPSNTAKVPQSPTESKVKAASSTENRQELTRTTGNTSSTSNEKNNTGTATSAEKPSDKIKSNTEQNTESANAEKQSAETAVSTYNNGVTEEKAFVVVSTPEHELLPSKFDLPAKPATESNSMTTGTGIFTPENEITQTSNSLTDKTPFSDKSTVNITEHQLTDDRSKIGNPKVDISVSDIGVDIHTENAVSSARSGNSSNAIAVVAQLAPQIARQVQNAQLQNADDQSGLQDIQAGQKLMAGNRLNAASTPTAIVAGTNGLNGPSLDTSQQVLIKTPVTQPGFAREIGHTVQWAIGKNLSTVDIRVNPESFGPINIRLVQKGQQVQLIIRTQDETSSNLLTQALSGLKEVLGQQGLQLTQVQIQHNNIATTSTQTNNPQQQFDQNNNQGQGRGGQQPAKGGNSQQNEAQLQTTTIATKTPGKLDLFA